MRSTAWDAWLAQLCHPDNRLAISALGYSATKPKWRIGAYKRDEYCVYFVVQHEAQGRVGGAALRLVAEDCIWLAPGVEQSFSNPDPARPVELFHLYFRLEGPGGEAILPPLAWLRGRGYAIKMAFKEMFEERRERRDFADYRLRHLLTGIFIQLARQRQRISSGQPALSPAHCVILENLARADGCRLSPAEMAAAVGLSVHYFRGLFTRTFGVPPRTWLLHGRIKTAAAHLCRSNATIAEMAEQSGYPDIFQFSKQFKAVMGVSPRAYRQSIRRQLPEGSTVAEVYRVKAV